MAHSARGRRLTEEHRRAQASLTEQLAVWLAKLFREMLDPDDIDLSTARFVKKASPVVMEARAMSWAASQRYLEEFRREELKAALKLGDYIENDVRSVPLDEIERILDALENPPPAELPDSLPSIEEVESDLQSSSGAVMKGAIKNGRTRSDAQETAEQAVASKSVKLVMEGGRSALKDEVAGSRHGCVGYARVVDSAPCPFCAMLASRGGIYRSDAFSESNSLFAGDGQFMVHDGCGCTLEPIYGHPLQNLPPGSEELVAEWAEIAAGRPDPWGHWRRWRESGTLPGEERSDVREKLEEWGMAAPTSAPQYGKGRKPKKGAPRRKQIDELTLEEVALTLKGMYVRRAGLQRELEKLETLGQRRDEPGPAQKIAQQLERLERNIDRAQERLA